MRLTDWKARPAGGAITITGTDADGVTRKVMNVREVRRERYGLLRTRVVARNAGGDYLATLA